MQSLMWYVINVFFCLFVCVWFLYYLGEETTMRGKGRHDPCVLPRAVPMVESMVALVLVDALMQHHAQCNLFSRDESFITTTNTEDSNSSSDTDSNNSNKDPLPNALGKKLSGYGISNSDWYALIDVSVLAV